MLRTCVMNMKIPHKGKFLLVGHRTDSMHKKVLSPWQFSLLLVLFKHRNEGEAICTYQAMLGNNKSHSKLTSEHTNPQTIHSYTNSSSFFHSLHWNVPLASTHNKKKLKCALKVCSRSNGLKRCTLGMQKCISSYKG